MMQLENELFFRTETISLQELTAAVVDDLYELLTQYHVTLEYTVESDFTVHRCNRSLLFTLVYNLATNAIKYNHPGGQVHLLGQPAPSGQGYLLEVHDTGPGIACAQLPYNSRSCNAERPGEPAHSGIGLAMAWTIAELHQIFISVDSHKGVGSSFRLLFPNVPRF
ncbi:HAMP domain-containing histidine kinase [Hymenobacter sp. BT175]|uniref:sensor histidine kinase n=1 Tax=Hymenobacter translucens TaxID=2886507 RepID=UPI001D0F24FB|nr:HAMP domain-containing sensor histidine kinase [Hymenobacter translucens]MCC2547434.1 HAMP domain-containing histidine kinase [Hymenobacter translucens]